MLHDDIMNAHTGDAGEPLRALYAHLALGAQRRVIAQRVKSLEDHLRVVNDLYEQGVKFLQGLSTVLFKGIDRPIDFVLEKVVTVTGSRFTGILRKAHNGHYANYLAWCLAGLIIVVLLVQFLWVPWDVLWFKGMRVISGLVGG